ncbi:MAG TPA: ADP-ribosylglycohydrolase family protein [Anaerovoracaceae bacterium]|nr:ADP-ribosylglycohydrolase family protein [Anaerovoracaceae bacterium]
MNEQLNRAIGCLYGGAIGDAMGMPASFLTRKQIRDTYGYIEGFLEPDRRIQDVHTELGAGDITDDTYESLIVANVLIENNGFNEKAFCGLMKNWAVENDMLNSDMIGPSTRGFLTALINGTDPKEGSKLADTNGSAMRVSPVGIFYWADRKTCIKEAAASSIPSHGSAPAVAAACAVASACAAGIRGNCEPEEIVAEAAKGAEYGEKIGFDIPAPSVYERILLVKEIVESMTENSIDEKVDRLTKIIGAGMKSYESVPLSLGIFYAAKGEPSVGIPAAVNAGDDADTNGSICGAICGAFSGIEAIPDIWVDRIQFGREDMDLQKVARDLITR